MFNVSAFFAALLIASIPLSLYILASIPLSFYLLAPGVYWRESGPGRLGELYRDEDGESIRETYDSFIRRSRRQIFFLLVVGCFGFVINGAAAVLRSGLPTEVNELPRLVETFVWIVASLLLSFHGVVMARTSLWSVRQKQGVISGICSLFIYSANAWYDLQRIMEPRTRRAFTVLHLLLMIVSITIGFTIPGRPLVFRDGIPIDREKSVAVLSRVTLSWANTTLSYAVRKGGLDFEDLSCLKVGMSTHALVSRFQEMSSNRTLWRTIVLAHRSTLCWQWLLTVLRSLVILAPQYLMYRLILTLEVDSVHPGSMALVWLALLGLAQLCYPWIEAWSLWIGWCHVALPINMELSGLTIQKSLRKRDTKHVKTNDQDIDDKETLHKSTVQDISEDNEIVGAETSGSSGIVDEINLISVDVERVSDFLSYNGMFLGLATSIAISLWFLLSIIRVQSILIGLGGVSVFVPLNLLAKKRYSKAQDDVMMARDLKTASVSEALHGIRQVKFDALEPQWLQRIRAVREVELSKQWNAYWAQALLVLCWIAGPTFFAAIALSVVSLRQGGLSPAVAFTALAIFQRLESTLNLVPELLTDFVNALVSVGRIEAFLNSPDRTDETTDADDIVFDDASIAWSSDQVKPGAFMLHNLDFTFPRHRLSLIVGATGSGKSLLLQAIVGESEILNGRVQRPKVGLALSAPDEALSGESWIVCKHTAFVAQSPWIENGPLRENVLFGLPFSQSRYAAVLDACALSQDIASMERGDLTEIGFNGVNLSGGQRARLTMARALYSRAEIVVIDDIFSAVDAQVGQHILKQALTGEIMRERTCILATHHVDLCRTAASFVVVLDAGTVKYAGSPTGLDDSTDAASHGLPHRDGDAAGSMGSPHALIDDGNGDDHAVYSPLAGKHKPIEPSLLDFRPFPEDDSEKRAERDPRQKGRIKSKSYKQYLHAASSWPRTYWFLVLFFLFAFEVALVGRSWLVKAWSDNDNQSMRNDAIMPSPSLPGFNSLHGYNLQAFVTLPIPSNRSPHDRNRIFIATYFAIAVIVSFLGTFKFFWVYLGSIRASRQLFGTMANTVLHAPLQWLDERSSGQILNRFLADFNTIDSQLANNLTLLAHSALQLLGISIIGAIVSPYLLVCVIPLIGACVFYAKTYLAGARDVKRLEAATKSPIFDTVSSILSGLSTIRAFDKTQHYIDHAQKHIDAHARCVWHLWLFNRWLGIRFAFIGALFTTAVAAFAVYSPSVSASFAGLALSFSLDFTDSVFWVLRRFADVEMNMNSLERVSEFCALPTEPTIGETPPLEWPQEGAIDVENLSVAYSPDGAPALRNISFKIPAGARMGIVGRTGAGKSSLTLALFRFLEAQTGRIVIDGIDISTISLSSLRGRMGIIPQHPVLWLGTVRSNLDPLEIYTDEQLLHALRRVNLLSSSHDSYSSSTSASSTGSDRSVLPSTQFTLSTPLSPSASNVSLGQRQLLSLARALLTSPRILLLDEATSAVDQSTDKQIQRVIREEMKGCTLLVIAHRLSTVRDFDGVMVVDNGEITRMGPPGEILGAMNE